MKVSVSRISLASLVVPIMAASMMMAPLGAAAQASGSNDHNVRLVQGGRTTLELSTTFYSALQSLGITVTADDSAEKRGAHLYLPIVAGSVVDLNTGRGNVLHSGAIIFAGQGVTATLTGLIFDSTVPQPVISAVLTENGAVLGRFNLFDATPPAGFTVPLTVTSDLLVLDNFTLTLDPSIATLLNSMGAGGSFQAGYTIGTVNFTGFVY
jgi:hypothetical protein